MRAFEVDDDHRPFALPLLRVREDLARPLPEPPVGELDLPDGERIGIGQRQQQAVAVRRVTGQALGIRHQVIGHPRHRAVEHLREPIVGVQLLPQLGRRNSPGESVHDDQLLADIQRALQELGLHALQLGAPFQQGLETHRVLDPQRLPQGDRLVGRFGLALVKRLRFPGVPACELGVQVRDRLANQFGDRRAVARPDMGGGQRLQLAQQLVVCLSDVRKRQRLDPSRGAGGVRERQFGQFGGFSLGNVGFLREVGMLDGGLLHCVSPAKRPGRCAGRGRRCPKRADKPIVPWLGAGTTGFALFMLIA